jgi:hypothetical protein
MQNWNVLETDWGIIDEKERSTLTIIEKPY